MNTTAKGNKYEEKSFHILEKAIKNGDLGLIYSHCKLERKKKFFSSRRNSNIIFDISLEVWPPNSKNFHLLYLVECKDYARKPVPADDLEEFMKKIDQIKELLGYNIKGVFITNAKFQRSAYELAKSYGIMYIQTDKDSYEIILHRALKDKQDSLFSNNFEKSYVEKQIESFFLNVFSQNEEKGICFYSHNDIESIGEDILSDYRRYSEDNIHTDTYNFCQYLYDKFNLKVIFNSLEQFHNQLPVLGCFDRESNSIFVNNKLLHNNKILRFVLFHEIGHFFLHKNIRINQSSYENFKDAEFDFSLNKYLLNNPKHWIEWQANQLATSLLMPKDKIKLALIALQRKLGIVRNTGKLYIDDQKVNFEDSKTILSSLSDFFKVTKTAIRYRLKSLDLIIENQKRNYNFLQPISQYSKNSSLEKNSFSSHFKSHLTLS